MELAKLAEHLKAVTLRLWDDINGVRVEGVRATSQAIAVLEELDDEVEEFKCELVEKRIHRRCYQELCGVFKEPGAADARNAFFVELFRRTECAYSDQWTEKVAELVEALESDRPLGDENN